MSRADVCTAKGVTKSFSGRCRHFPKTVVVSGTCLACGRSLLCVFRDPIELGDGASGPAWLEARAEAATRRRPALRSNAKWPARAMRACGGAVRSRSWRRCSAATSSSMTYLWRSLSGSGSATGGFSRLRLCGLAQSFGS